jgi:hypothetical protein
MPTKTFFDLSGMRIIDGKPNNAQSFNPFEKFLYTHLTSGLPITKKPD